MSDSSQHTTRVSSKNRILFIFLCFTNCLTEYLRLLNENMFVKSISSNYRFQTMGTAFCLLYRWLTCLLKTVILGFPGGAVVKNPPGGGASRWRKSKTRRSPSSPQIHQKYIYMWNNSYRTCTERWQKTSDLPKGKKLPTYLGRAKEKRKNRDKE